MAPETGSVINNTGFREKNAGVMMVVGVTEDNNTGKSVCSYIVAVIAPTWRGRIFTGCRCNQ
jgi:hypothetical protein